MTDIGIVMLVVWIAIGGFMLATNRDQLSPAKVLHIYLLMFFLAILYRNEGIAMYLTYVVLLCASLFIGLNEALSLKHETFRFDYATRLNFTDKQVRILLILLCIGSLVPVLAQLYMISSFGGFFRYLIAMKWRVKEFGGWGPVILVIKLIFVVNLLYFIILVFSNLRTKLAILFFVLHTVVTVSIGLLSGSRSLVLMNFVSMLIVYNYWAKPVTVKLSLGLGVFLFALAILLGQIRSGGMSVSDSDIDFVNRQAGVSFAERARVPGGAMSAGFEGMKLVYEQNVVDKQYGLTFMTVFTNLIPSSVWDNKPRSGGLVLTQDFTGDAWGGFSNLSTGLITESIINFGLAPGLVLGFGLLISLFLLFNRIYLKVRYRRIGGTPFQLLTKLTAYIYTLQAVAGLLVGEFTNITIGLVLQLVSLTIIMSLLKIATWTIDLPNRGTATVVQ